MEPNRNALLVMDYVNDIVSENGKLAGKGYPVHIREQNAINNVESAIDYSRNNNIPVIYVRVGFSSDYKEQPKNSPLFGKADEFGALNLDEWGGQIYSQIRPKENDVVIEKNRVSPFYGTNLELILRNFNIENVFMAGVATDLVVESAARDAHDRGYNVNVLSDSCAAANENDHQKALSTLEKISKVINTKDYISNN